MADDYESLSQALRSETTYKVDDFNKGLVITGLDGLALKLQNLCLTRPDTLPNLDDFGLGIQDYLFELNDTATLAEIAVVIMEGVNKWIPDSAIQDVTVEKLEANALGNNSAGILVGFEIYDDAAKTLILSLYGATSTSTSLESEIYVS